MIRAIALVAFATACSSSSTDPAPAPAPAVAATKAGAVVEVAGKVTATRAGATRDLAVGAEVSGDDVVATGDDGNIVIELVHNHARWSLGPGRRGAVRESAAWGLPMAESVAAAVAGDMSAAGRHDEKSAVDTVASTDVTTPVKPKPIEPPKPTNTGGLGLKGTGPGGGGTGEGIGLGSIGTIGHGAGGGNGQGYGAGHGKLGGGHTVKAPTVTSGQTTVQGAIPPEVIARVVRQQSGRLRLCYETGLQKDPTLHGKVVVKFVIDKTGAVPTAVATGFDPDVDRCITRVFLGLAFPTPDGGIVQVSYPITFDPGD